MHRLFELSRFSLALIFAAAICVPATTFGQDDDEPTLTIGSKAPDLDIEYWISDNDGLFEQVTKIEDGKVYVVEFWATWCGPCISAMPTIAKLQKKYEDKDVQVISISDEEIDTIDEFLERKMRGDEDGRTYGELTNSYCLTSDPDESVMDDYFKAAGQSGIPCAFLVGKTGLIEWIGHPMELDKPLKQVVNGDWDREKFLVAYNKELEDARKEKELRRKMAKALRPVKEAVNDGDEDKAIELIDELLMDEEMADLKSQLSRVRQQIIVASAMLAIREKIQDDGEDVAIEFIDGLLKDEKLADFKGPLQAQQLQLMIKVGHERAATALNQFAEDNKENANGLNDVAWGIYELHVAKGNVDKEVLAAAKKASEYSIKSQPENGAYLDTLAHLVYVVDGDLDKAIEIQTKAVKYAGPQLGEIKPFLKQLQKEKETGEKEADF